MQSTSFARDKKHKAGAVVFVNRFYRPDHSATSQLLTDLAERLGQRGYRVGIVTTRQLYDDPAAALAKYEKISDVRIYRVATSRFGRRILVARLIDYLTCYCAMFVQLLRILRAGDCVVAKTDPPMISVVAALAARLKGAMLINWLQDVFPEVAVRSTRSQIMKLMCAPLRILRDRSLVAARRNVVLSREMQDCLAPSGANPNHWRVIPNWADGAAIRPLPASASRLRLQLGWQNRFVVGYSGNLGLAHDFLAILGAARILHDVVEVRFLMIGGGTRMRALQQQVSASGLPNIAFVDYRPREELADSLGAIDLHLVSLNPEFEGLIVPSKIYGIFAAGRPCLFIGHPNSSIAQLLRNHCIGDAVDAGDGAALAQLILQRASDPAECHAAGVRARALFDKDFSKHRAVRAWENLLSECGIY